MARVGIVGDDHNLGWACHKVDSHFTRQELFRGGDVDISWAYYAVDFRNRGRAEGKRRNGLSAAYPKYIWRIQQPRRRQNLHARTRRRNTDGLHTRDLRWNYRHQ